MRRPAPVAAGVFASAALVLASLATIASAQEAIKSPLEKAKVGQWVRYKMTNDMEMKQSIVKVEVKKFTIKHEMWMKGQPLPSNESVVDLEKKSEGDKKGEAPKIEDAVLEVNAKKLKCKVSTSGNVKTWHCEEVPVYGVVRQEMDGKATMELIAWGERADEDKGPQKKK